MRTDRPHHLTWLRLIAVASAAFCLLQIARGDVPEITYPDDDFKRLDTFEAHELNKADKTFESKKYPLAVAAYDAFILEFPRSAAIPYALVRKGRSLQLSNKRYEAIKEYQEVLDYFPNQVRYAAAALYYQGLCHHQNQDIKQALLAWTKMAEDVDYSKHPFAGQAFKELADNLMRQKRTASAMKYYRMALEGFRQRLGYHERRHAIDRLTTYHVRWKPDVEALADLYVAIKGFNPRHPMKNEDIPEKPLEDGRFWSRTMDLVDEYGEFDKFHKNEEKNYYRYWSETMEGRFPKWDDYNLTQAKFERRVHGDIERWYKRMDGIYASGHTEENRDQRTVRWVQLLAHHGAKVQQYLDKLDPKELNGKLTHSLITSLAKAGQKELAVNLYPWVNPEDLDWDQKQELLKMLYRELKDRDMAHNFFAKLNMPKTSDKIKEQVARTLHGYDEELVMKCYELMDNVDRANYLRVKYYHAKEQFRKGLEIVPKVIQAPDYAKQGWWLKAELHDMAHEWEQAINAYRQSDNPPGSLFRIAENYMRLGKLENAINQLREIEGFFKDHASRAALQVARYYQRAKKRPEEIAALRHVMKKYTESREAPHAHERLEDLGVDMGNIVEDATKKN